jgi:hypothetical protein
MDWKESDEKDKAYYQRIFNKHQCTVDPAIGQYTGILSSLYGSHNIRTESRVGFSCMIVERPKMDIAERTDIVYLNPADMATLLLLPTATSPVYLVVGTIKYECLPHSAVDRFCVAMLQQQRISQNLPLGDRILCYPSS